MTYVLDTKEENLIELLNIPANDEVIDISSYNIIQPDTSINIVNNIQLDKTNIETYMNDFNKNFYKIKFENTMLKDITELHNIREDSDASNLREKSFGEDLIDSKETKQIKATPIYLNTFSSQLNYPSTVISKIGNSLKSEEINNYITTKEATNECVGIYYSANVALMYPTFNSNWTINSGTSVIPINMNLSIPAFNLYSSDVGIDLLDVIPEVDTNCNSENTGDIIFSGYPCDANVQICKKCIKFKIFGKRYKKCISYPCGLQIKLKNQIYLKKANYIPSKLIDFNGVGINFNGKIENNFGVRFEMETNIPIQIIIDIIKNIDKDKHSQVMNITDLKVLINILKNIFTFQNIVQIMFLAYSVFVEQSLVTTPYVDFLITSIYTKLNLTLQYFSVNYGSQKYEVSNITFNKDFEALEDGKYISFSLNPLSVTLKAEFVFFSGTLSELLLKIASANAKNYLNIAIMNNPSIAIKGGMFLVLLLIIYETVLKNDEEINVLNAIINKTDAQKENIINLTNKNKVLNNIITEILKYYNIFKSVNIGGVTSLISNIIDKYDPFVRLSIGVCGSPVFPPLLTACGLIQMEKILILNLLKQVIISIINTVSQTISICAKISDAIVNEIPIDEIKDLISELNNKIEDANDTLRKLLIIATQNVFNVLDDAELGLTLSPLIQWCIPL
jgi:hypothetical protein